MSTEESLACVLLARSELEIPVFYAVLRELRDAPSRPRARPRSTFSVESFVPLLVGLLDSDSNPDAVLLAARALTQLADVLPQSRAAIVHFGALPGFCARLVTIEDIEIAEQSLQALEKLSREHGAACVRAGGLVAVLSFLDFFALGQQRVAVASAAHMCRSLPAELFDRALEVAPTLTQLLATTAATRRGAAGTCD